MNNHQKPVFLHGMWRSCSTYIWSSFRNNSQTFCLYEPLHQGLGKITKDRIYRDSKETHKNNHHGKLTNPYFFEYEALINRRGLPYFKKSFGFRNYVLRENNQHPDLKRYIDNLLIFAGQNEKTPILGFNRAGLRLDWLRNNFECYQIHIERNPRDIFHSYYRNMREGNYTYFASWIRVIENNPDLQKYFPFIPRPTFAQKHLMKEKPRYRKFIQNQTTENLYKLVFAFWILHVSEALQFSDFIIDINNSGNKDYMHKAVAQIQTNTGLIVNFDDIDESARDTQGLLEFEMIENQMIEHFQNMGHKIDGKNLKSLSNNKQALLKHFI